MPSIINLGMFLQLSDAHLSAAALAFASASPGEAPIPSTGVEVLGPPMTILHTTLIVHFQVLATSLGGSSAKVRAPNITLAVIPRITEKNTRLCPLLIAVSNLAEVWFCLNVFRSNRSAE